MPDACPARTDLHAFAAGKLPDHEQHAVEKHLAGCLPCAQALEALTRAQWDKLVGGRAVGPSATATSPVLETVMRNAAEGQGNVDRADVDRFLRLLDPSTAEGALGTFAGYDILEIAGRGGMGVVLRARDRTLDRVVAVKVLLAAGSGDERRVAGFLEEARAVAAIPHDHIVAVHQAGMEKGLPYLVMPFHGEGALEHWLADGAKIAPREAAQVGLQLARALAATHARGILHRDIKPSNILLEHGLERVRLADFGLAQPLGSGAASGVGKPSDGSAQSTPAVAGTPQYMSPEQARGETIDARSDLFGLGAVLFRLVTGRTVYAGSSLREILQAAARCEIQPVRAVASEVPPALAALIDRLLAKRAEARFASADEVVRELERFVTAESWLRILLTRAAMGLLAVCVVAGAAVLVLDWSGQTVIVNSFWCRRTDDGYYIRGRFGTYAELGAAVLASRPGEVIEVRFSGERVTDGFRAGGKPLTLRAAAGFAPTLVATNNGQPLILVDGPLALEGLTLIRRVNAVGFAPLLTVQGAPLFVLNCRLARTTTQGASRLLRAGRLVPVTDENRTMRPLVVLASDGPTSLRNCVLLGFHATGVGLKGDTNGAHRVRVENSLFVTHRAFGLRPEPGFRADVEARRSVFVSQALMDLADAGAVRDLTVRWEDCAFDRSQGALLRLNRYGTSDSLRAVHWTETNTVYAGSGAFVSDRRNARVDSETEWNVLMRLAAHSHVATPREIFADIGARSDERLEPSDVNIAGLRRDTGLDLGFDAQRIGAGEAYDRFRRQREYGVWREEVEAAFDEWQRHRVPGARPGTR